MNACGKSTNMSYSNLKSKYRHVEDEAALAEESLVYFSASASEHSGVVQNGHNAQYLCYVYQGGFVNIVGGIGRPVAMERTDVFNSRGRQIHSQQHTQP